MLVLICLAVGTVWRPTSVGAWQAMSVHDDLCDHARVLQGGWPPLRNPFKLARPRNSSSDVEMNRQIRNKVPIYLKFHKGVYLLPGQVTPNV